MTLAIQSTSWPEATFTQGVRGWSVWYYQLGVAEWTAVARRGDVELQLDAAAPTVEAAELAVRERISAEESDAVDPADQYN